MDAVQQKALTEMRLYMPVVLIYSDHTWDVNEYLLGLREEVKSWKEVYWRSDLSHLFYKYDHNKQ